MSSETAQTPRSRTWWLYIENQNPVPVIVIAPGGSRLTLAAGATYNSYTNGVHHVAAPGTPDVTYFKVHYEDLSNMSTEQGPLNGLFTVKVEMSNACERLAFSLVLPAFGKGLKEEVVLLYRDDSPRLQIRKSYTLISSTSRRSAAWRRYCKLAIFERPPALSFRTWFSCPQLCLSALAAYIVNVPCHLLIPAEALIGFVHRSPPLFVAGAQPQNTVLPSASSLTLAPPLSLSYCADTCAWSSAFSERTQLLTSRRRLISTALSLNVNAELYINVFTKLARTAPHST
ncbi:hypothetical protein GALMADRAFT_146599 [Galerina marginata CBS 339.88]|uniref:Uncharacterized protein n=1 Tax=Galerina marginata (strain CBS 339.88) TaxID=685588 RepID=A0A067SK71_GALM3|nr:hypothetical protein GALMADRAFT_146599 [Galerina marginata CBS 339.88]